MHFKMRPLSLSVHYVLTAPLCRERERNLTREEERKGGDIGGGVGDVVQQRDRGSKKHAGHITTQSHANTCIHGLPLSAIFCGFLEP